MDYFVQINDDPHAALVHSLSFGGRERGYEQDGGARCNVEIMKAGARGMTIVAASGDSGVYYPGLLPLWLAPRAFQPMFPQTSPYVTGKAVPPHVSFMSHRSAGIPRPAGAFGRRVRGERECTRLDFINCTNNTVTGTWCVE